MECSTLAYSNKLRFNVPLGYPGTPSQGNNPRGKLLQRLGQNCTTGASTALYDDGRARQVARNR
jgi:hypothetical protein